GDTGRAPEQSRKYLGIACGGRSFHLAPDRAGSQLGGDFAAPHAAPAVAHDEQPSSGGGGGPRLPEDWFRGALPRLRGQCTDECGCIEIADEEVILVVLADLADVAAGGHRDCERVGHRITPQMARTFAHRPSSMRRSWSPMRT